MDQQRLDLFGRTNVVSVNVLILYCSQNATWGLKASGQWWRGSSNG